MNEPTVIKLDNPDCKAVRIFAVADRHPVRVEIDGVIYRIEQEDNYHCYHPETGQGKTGDAEHD